MKTLMDLEPEDCRYPFGDESILFCAEAKLEKSSYCEFHHRLCWTPVISKPAKSRVYHGTDFSRGAA